MLFGTALELRIECAGSVMRREFFFELPRAIDTEAEWRLQYDMEVAAPDSLPVVRRCSECTDAAVVEVNSETGSTWLRCPSCGNVWLADDPQKTEMATEAANRC
jgi:hypothetical protein